MPVYVYECQRCGYRFDRLESLNDPPTTTCPVIISGGGDDDEPVEYCDGETKRVPARSNFKLIGKGFYVNDYPKNDKGHS
ncbi:MAG TPA: FmdB family zinc ribbon protein [Actinomycetota bacterium]|nr:FmdB family zinc ribbon protein [Actinomycetota bacterium]